MSTPLETKVLQWLETVNVLLKTVGKGKKD